MKGFFKFVLALLIVVVVILAGAYIAISIPKKVNVTWSEADVQSYMQKTKSQIGTSASGAAKSASLEDLLLNNFKSTGKVAVEGVLTPSEVTAMANTVIRGKGIFKDIAINFRDDGTMEASAQIGSSISSITAIFPEAKKYENIIKTAEGKPIYWRYSLERTDEKRFDGHTVELRVGQVPIPLPQAAPGLTEAGSAINNMLAKLDGFSCDSFKIDKEGLHFKGTIPDALEYVNASNPLNQ